MLTYLVVPAKKGEQGTMNHNAHSKGPSALRAIKDPKMCLYSLFFVTMYPVGTGHINTCLTSTLGSLASLIRATQGGHELPGGTSWSSGSRLRCEVM